MIKKYKLFNSDNQLEKAIPPGAKKMIKIGERRVCVFHTPSGFKIFDNLCPHNGQSLLEGNINYLNEIVCPLHGYRYSLTDGKECNERTQSLGIHKIEIKSEGVFLVITS